ncbi:MAG TPA: hypothetical protein VM429_12960, partial [Micropruina sp.]|nr:hypothetical protein [Micropruina sp.]
VLTLNVLQPFSVTVSAASKVKKGKKLTISGKVTPMAAAADSGVTLQIKTGSQWRDLVDETTSATGTYRIQVIFKVVGTKKLRVLKQAASGLTERTSRTFSVKVVR